MLQACLIYICRSIVKTNAVLLLMLSLIQLLRYNIPNQVLVYTLFFMTKSTTVKLLFEIRVLVYTS